VKRLFCCRDYYGGGYSGGGGCSSGGGNDNTRPQTPVVKDQTILPSMPALQLRR